MKRIFIIIIISLVSLFAYTQNWNHIKHDISLSLNKPLIVNNNGIIELELGNYTNIWYNGKNIVYSYNKPGYSYELVKSNKLINTDIKYLPSYVYERYKFGNRLTTAGSVLISFGLFTAAIGGIFLCSEMLYGNNNKSNPSNIHIASVAMIAVGGTFVGISLPLLCFGDAAKREANVNYDMFNLQYKK